MKRYVMLEDKTIFDRQEMPTIKFDNDYIKNQADNLLDLLEVRDCYETKDGEIYSIDNTYQLTEQKTFYSYSVNLINAIWKRNGDVMRRYEI